MSAVSSAMLRCGRATAPVVDQAFQPTEPGHGMLDHRLDAGSAGDIGANEAQRRTAPRLQRLSFGFAPTGADHLGALRDEHLGDAFADNR
jgi:hypothetical protein